MNAFSMVSNMDVKRLGTGGSTRQHIYTSDGNIDMAKFWAGADPGDTSYQDLEGLEFFGFKSLSGSLALLEDDYKGNINFEDETIKRSGHTYYNFGAHMNYLTTSTNGGRLLELANRASVNTRFFGGITQTAASLFDFLQNKYGPYEAFYGSNGFSPMNPGYDDSIGTVVSIIQEPGYKIPNGTLQFEDLTCTVDCADTIILPEEYYSVSRYVATGYIFFADAVPPEKLAFDVYVDGVIGGKGPQMMVKWRNTNPNSQLSDSMITPRVWGWPVPQEGSPDIVANAPLITEDGIRVPNETDRNQSRIQYTDDFTFDGQFASPYVSLSTVMIGWRPAGDQIAFFGPDRICDFIRLYLRFDYEDTESQQNQLTWGDLYYVDIPYEYEGAAYISAVMVDNSDKDSLYRTEVNIIGGLPPEDPEPDDDEPVPGEDTEGDPSSDGPYGPDGYEDLSDGEPDGFDGDAVLTTTYAMPKLTMQSVGADIWSQSYFDVLKIQSNPIENIIACKWFPMALSGTPNTPIKIGDVTLGVSADKIGTMYTKSFGSYTHGTASDRPGYLSLTPYCIIKMHLPYVGIIQLDATELFKRVLTGKYVVDLITGDVLVILYLDGNPYMTLTGKMGVDIPLTATNRVQTELAAASRAFSAVMGAAGQMANLDPVGAGGTLGSGILSITGMDYSSQRCTSHSPACCTYENLWIFLELAYNPAPISAGYKSQRGQPAHIYQTLQYMKNKGGGFIQVDMRTTINVAMTEEENRMLEQIMTTGFYL